LNVLCSDESDLPKQMTFNKGGKNLANSRELGGTMNCTKYAPSNLKNLTVKYLLGLGQKVTEKKEMRMSRAKAEAPLSKQKNVELFLKESKRISFTKMLWQIEHYYFIILYFTFIKSVFIFLI